MLKKDSGIISDIQVNNIIEHFPLRMLGFLFAIMYSMHELFSIEFEINQKNISKDDIRVSIKCMCISFLHRSKIVIVHSYLPFCFELFLFHSKTPKRSDNKLCKGYKIILIYISSGKHFANLYFLLS